MFGGGAWPVVQRELRAAARRRWSYWLRVASALGGLVVFWAVAETAPMRFVGIQVIENIHLMLLGLICGFVPALTADCIASERREGTLGLLFLTPLTAAGIVLGKVQAHMLWVLNLWLAVLPVLTIPFLVGGLSLVDVTGFFIIELCAGMLCMAAGLLASSLTESYTFALILAFLLVGAFVAGSGQYRHWWMNSPAGGSVVVTASGGYATGTNGVILTSGSIRVAASADAVTAGFFVGPQGEKVTSGPFTQGAIVASNGITYTLTNGYIKLAYLGPVTGLLGITSAHQLAKNLAVDFIVAAIILFAAFYFASWCVEQSWQENIPTERLESWSKRRSSPLFDRWFAVRQRRTLEWNPVAWLPQFSWKARLSKWSLCLLVLALEGAVFLAGVRPYSLGGLVTIPILIFVVAYTAAGVNGLLQEKKNGTLEIILVSPLSVKHIIFGRVWGLWQQFLPSVIVLCACEVARQMIHPHSGGYGGAYWEGNWGAFCIKDLEIVAVFLTLPVIATRFALTSNKPFVACVLTVAVGLAPAITLLGIPLESDHVIGPPEAVLPAAVGFSLLLLAAHAALAGLAYDFSRENLRRESKMMEEA
jgi:ABC-type Na+ efflux pump permease subunit